MNNIDTDAISLNVYNAGKKDAVKEIINTIENEIEKSLTATYVCNDEEKTEIGTDVGYVADWLREYKKVLYKKYGIDNHSN